MNKRTKRPKKIDLWDEGWGEEDLGFDKDWENNDEELDEEDYEE